MPRRCRQFSSTSLTKTGFEGFAQSSTVEKSMEQATGLTTCLRHKGGLDGAGVVTCSQHPRCICVTLEVTTGIECCYFCSLTPGLRRPIVGSSSGLSDTSQRKYDSKEGLESTGLKPRHISDPSLSHSQAVWPSSPTTPGCCLDSLDNEMPMSLVPTGSRMCKHPFRSCWGRATLSLPSCDGRIVLQLVDGNPCLGAPPRLSLGTRNLKLEIQ